MFKAVCVKSKDDLICVWGAWFRMKNIIFQIKFKGYEIVYRQSIHQGDGTI